MHRSLVTALACLITALGARSVAADPIEMMSLWESPAATDPIDPWPAGLRIVIYDNGQVLKVVRPPTASDQAQVVIGHVSPEGAKLRAARTLAVLSDAPRPEDIKANFQEQRWTVLQVWDAAKQDHVKWAVAGHPCAAIEGNAVGAMDQQVRAQLDERFRTACDLLANTLVSDPVAWSPEMIRIDLARAEDKAGIAKPWPRDWFEEARWGGNLFVCVNKEAASQDLTRKLVSFDKSEQQSAFGLLVSSPDGNTWRISGVQYALPGAISHVYGEGSDSISLTAIADGPCRHP